MGGSAGEGGGEDAGGDHAVGVAEGGDSCAEEEVVRGEGGGCGDGVDLVGFVVLNIDG